MHIALVTDVQQEALVDLLCEINSYYNPDSPADRKVVRDHAYKNLFSPASPHRLVIVSQTDGRVVGLAAITLMYSLVEPEPARRSHCHLKELYVSAPVRSQGVGRALMAWVAKFALENGCHRIDWPVKAANTKGISFYASLGAERVKERLSFRLTEPSVSRLAAQSGIRQVGLNLSYRDSPTTARN